MRKMFPLSIILSFLLSLFANNAFAHDANGAHNFTNGFTHPLLGTDHILMMIGVGILAAKYDKKLRFILPIGFVVGMFLGMIVATSGFVFSFNEHLIALSVIIFGILLGFKIVPPIYFGALIVMIAGLLHGHAHTIGIGNGANSYVLGALIATSIMHLLGYFIGIHTDKGQKVSVIYGTIMAIFGAIMLAA
jgi:urease accessory protein